jgi:hypothetical protein
LIYSSYIPGGVYLFVKGGQLTTLDTSQVVAVGEEGILPCLPAFPGKQLTPLDTSQVVAVGEEGILTCLPAYLPFQVNS